MQRTYGLDHRPLIDSLGEPVGERVGLPPAGLRQRARRVVAVPVTAAARLGVADDEDAHRPTARWWLTRRGFAGQAGVAGGPLAHDRAPTARPTTMPTMLWAIEHAEAVGVGVGEVVGIAAELPELLATS